MKLIAALSLLILPAQHGGLEVLQAQTTINEQERLEAARSLSVDQVAPFLALHEPAYKLPVKK